MSISKVEKHNPNQLSIRPCSFTIFINECIIVYMCEYHYIASLRLYVVRI